MCWVLINCLTSCCDSEEKAPKARLEIRGPPAAIQQLESTIRQSCPANKLGISCFTTRSSDTMQVVLYRKGNSYQIYEGSPNTDLNEISRTVQHNIWVPPCL